MCAAAALAALGPSAAADTYLVPPAPVSVSLRAGERALSVHAGAIKTRTPQRVYIELAMIGPPIRVMHAGSTSLVDFGGEEDAGPPALKAAAPVGINDLTAVRNILQARGISPNDIHVSLSADERGRIGEIIVAVTPATASRFRALASTVASILAEYPNIRGAGTIVGMNDCSERDAAFAEATKRATAHAIALGRTVGFTSGAFFRNDEHTISEDNYHRTFCGAEALPRPQFDLGAPASTLGPYQVGVEGGLAFHIVLAGRTPASAIHFLETSAVTPFTSALAAHQFVIANDEPFVSTQGRFSGVVPADAIVAVYKRSDSIANLHAAIKSVGLPASSLYRDEHAIYVRLRNEEDTAKIARSAFAPVFVYRFIDDCSAIEEAAASQAFRRARLRAETMASATHMRIGALIAVADTGSGSGAICGYGKSSTLRVLVRAISPAAGAEILPGSGATFAQTIAVAWHLIDVVPASRATAVPTLAPPYEYGTLNEAFLTRGVGVLGSSTRSLRPTSRLVSVPVMRPDSRAFEQRIQRPRPQNSDGMTDLVGDLRPSDPPDAPTTVGADHLLYWSDECSAIQSEALRSATADAIAHMGRATVQAIIDQGPVYAPSASICGLRNSVSQSGLYVGGLLKDYDKIQWSVTQRVLVVTGSPRSR